MGLVSFLNFMLFGLILFDIVIFEGFAISLDRSIGKRSGAGRGCRLLRSERSGVATRNNGMAGIGTGEVGI